MIKILLHEPELPRNKIAYHQFVAFRKLFYEMGLEFVDYGNHDFVFMGDDSFINRKIGLDQSIEFGIDQVNKQRAAVFLFDSSDSTSLLGSYEVLENTNARHLFKNQLLSKEDYKKESPFGKWWWNDITGLEIGELYPMQAYDIPDHLWYKIKLSGWNIGYNNQANHQFVDGLNERDIDVCALWNFDYPENRDHGYRNDLFYNTHRIKAIGKLQRSDADFQYKTGIRPIEEYYDILGRSKMAISPYGMGEITNMDFDCMRFGTLMIKPAMDKIQTIPDFYMPYKTYIPCKPDWSDLTDVIHDVLINYDDYKKVSDGARLRFRRRYMTSLIGEYWYNIFKLQPGITLEHFIS